MSFYWLLCPAGHSHQAANTPTGTNIRETMSIRFTRVQSLVVFPTWRHIHGPDETTTMLVGSVQEDAKIGRVILSESTYTRTGPRMRQGKLVHFKIMQTLVVFLSGNATAVVDNIC